jgi:hypothetical protein
MSEEKSQAVPVVKIRRMVETSLEAVERVRVLRSGNDDIPW